MNTIISSWRKLNNDILESISAVVTDLNYKSAVFSVKDNRPALERPKDKTHGDISTSFAMEAAKMMGHPPRELAEKIVARLNKNKPAGIDKIEVAGPGFINFFVSNQWYCEIVKEIEKSGKNYGTGGSAAGQKIQFEFVSANPTGPLNVVSARAAAAGDCLARLWEAIGAGVEREYYVNDTGNQVELLGKSVCARYDLLFGKSTPVPDEGYHGEYVSDIAKKVKESCGERYLDLPDTDRVTAFKDLALQEMLSKQQEDLDAFRIGRNLWHWSYEHELHPDGVNNAIQKLEKKGFVYETDRAKYFKSTELGDEKDRVLVKSDGQPTYFAADIAYHICKFERGFDRIIDIWGPDHHGHIARIKASLGALGLDVKKMDILICQQVNLISDGEKIKMSKRAGKLVTMKELLDEVGVDAARYFFLMRSMDSHLDFDLALAKKQSDENPVYYIQYAHARICSILKYAKEQNAPLVSAEKTNLGRLNSEQELALLKQMSRLPDLVESAARTFSPHWLHSYLQELATSFHRFYTEHRVVTDDAELTSARLCLIAGVKTVIANVLSLMGISAPEKM